MFRLRRYRVFVLFAALTIYAFHRFGNPRNWEAPSSHSVNVIKERLSLVASGKSTRERQQQQDRWRPRKNSSPQSPLLKPLAIPGAKITSQTPPPPVAEPTKPVQKAPPPAQATNTVREGPMPQGESVNEEHGRMRVLPNPPKDGGMRQILEQGASRWETDQLHLDIETPRWEKQKEQFPVSFTIPMPTGTPKAIPKIQATFDKESNAAKKDRLEKRDVVKEAFLHAWNGYRNRAWGKDELMPVSGGSKNPFSGWAATLVDSLDTLWIMGLKTEFEEAVDFVRDLDFKRSRRADIPIFETTIRYLGGLVGAYDVSGGKYRVLLDKAVELADIMMGSFDTPNRMPDTFYRWKPVTTSQQHRASVRVVLAELGSLAVEFTRLAQLTKEPKYYDAIARITSSLEEWQNRTRLPGMWPTYVDASGCARIAYKAPPNLEIQTNVQNKLDWKGNPIGSPPIAFSNSKGPTSPMEPVAQAASGNGRIQGWDLNHPEEKEKPMEPMSKPEPIVFAAKSAPVKALTKRQFNADTLKPETPAVLVANTPPKQIAPSAVPKAVLPECIPNGLGSQSEWGNEEFTLGALADSTYEYLPKQFMLLGGLVDQYRTMYENAIEAAKERLLFRAMIPDSKREILIAGVWHVSTPSNPDMPSTERLAHEGSHLSCFAGGMFALGAKLFDRKEDLEIAAKLTDGCVWAYETTATGIMPETFVAIPCDDRKNCAWNETKWWDELDPNPQWRSTTYQNAMEYYNRQIQEREAEKKSKAQQFSSTATTATVDLKSTRLGGSIGAVKTTAPTKDSLKSTSNMERKRRMKRQLDDALGGKIAANIAAEQKSSNDAKALAIDKSLMHQQATSTTKEAESVWTPPASTTIDDTPPAIYSPDKPLSHEEFAKQVIKEDRIPPGMRNIQDRRYILRPEALESVFYMHRITGSPYWRLKGWNMITSILKHTRTPLAHAAIDDVTKTSPGHEDSMESFWLAETLKYAWLLMDDEDAWSLDDWILNTEAHFFKREVR